MALADKLLVMKKYLLGLGAVMSAFAFTFISGTQVAAAQFATTTAGTLVDSVTTNVGSVLASVLVAIVALLAALIGLGMGIRYFKRWIGRK